VSTKNTIKTAVLLASLTGLFVLAGLALGGTSGMIIALAFALVLNGAAYWFSDRLALAMGHARPVERSEAPELYAMVEDLSQRAGVPLPKVYQTNDSSPNAFATGRDPGHAAIAVTTGILELLGPRELYGVLAHEFAHIKHRDILISSVAAAVAGAITALANIVQFATIFGHRDDEEGNGGLMGGIAMLLLAPLAATLIQLAISRAREYAADAGGAQIAGDPIALASALRKLETGVWLRPMNVNPAAASMYIVHPFTHGGISRLFQTHPPMAERIARLEAMATPVRTRTQSAM
jgi:heat shock protein HtpX